MLCVSVLLVLMTGIVFSVAGCEGRVASAQGPLTQALSPAAVQPTEQPSPEVSPKATLPKAPLIAHAIENHETCTNCHATKALVPLPATHAGRTSATCLACHEAAPTRPPRLPHRPDGHRLCFDCHIAGKVGALPSSHKWRNDNRCIACHEPWPGGVPEIRHKLENRKACLMCHELKDGVR